MTKPERAAYHLARIAASEAQPKASAMETKAEKRARERAKQEADRQKKDEQGNHHCQYEADLEELKMQMTEEQAREVLRQMAETDALKNLEEEKEEDDDEDEEDDTLLGSVRIWMVGNEQARTDDESLHDFNLKVRFQGHVSTTPPDHLGAILHVLSEQVCDDFDLVSMKQPALVAKRVKLRIVRWAYILNELYKKCDALEAADIVVSSVHEGVASVSPVAAESAIDCAVVGLLMALRQEVSAMADEDLLMACRRSGGESKVMRCFVTFLEEAAQSTEEEC